MSIARDIAMGTDLTEFDYRSLAPELAGEIKDHVAAIRTLTDKAGRSIVEIGQRLIAIKAKVSRGTFLQLVERECRYTTRTAQRFMQIARFIEGIEPNTTRESLSGMSERALV